MKQQRTIVLLHGWGRAKSASSYYAKTIAEFKKNGYVVYAPDLPGFGTAGVPSKPLTLHDYAEFVHEYIKKQNIQPTIFIGHSFGGRVIIQHCSEYTFTGKAIILSGTPGVTPVKRGKILVSLIIAKIGHVIFTIPGFSLFAEKIRGWFYYLIGARDFYRAEGAMRETFKNIIKERLDDKMKIIQTPTLLLWGEEDIIVPLPVAQRMQQIFPHATLSHVPSFGHGFIVDAPVQFVKNVLQFIQSI